MSNKNEAKDNEKLDIVEYDALNASFDFNNIATYKSPVYFETTDQQRFVPMENTHEVALGIIKACDYTRAMLHIAPRSQSIMDRNASALSVIQDKIAYDLKLNWTGIMFNGVISLIRLYIIEDNLKMYDNFNSWIDSLIPNSYPRNHYNICNPDRIPDYFKNYDDDQVMNADVATDRVCHLLEVYTADINRKLMIDLDIIMNMIDVFKFANDQLKNSGINPDELTPGSKIVYARGIIQEQMSMDMNKMIEVCELVLMNGFALVGEICKPVPQDNTLQNNMIANKSNDVKFIEF